MGGILTLALSVVCVNALLMGSAIAKGVSSQAEACKLLIRAVKPPTPRADPHAPYYCELYRKSPHYYVFALRSKRPAPVDSSADWVGSSLVGHFAVRRNDGAVLEWDFAADK